MATSAVSQHRATDEKIARDKIQAQRACDREAWVRNTGIMYGAGGAGVIAAFDYWAQRNLKDWRAVPMWARVGTGAAVAYLGYVFGREKAWDRCVKNKLTAMDPTLYRDLNEGAINQRSLLSTKPDARINPMHDHKQHRTEC